MDLSITGYLMLFPGLIIMATSWFSGKIISRILNIYTLILLFIISFLVCADLELYRNWGFRMDTTPLMYLRNFKEVAASTNQIIAIILIIFWIIFSYLTYKIYYRLLGGKIKYFEKSDWKTTLLFVPLIGALILPIRGGVGIAPINIGSVYFHKTNEFANHAAINLLWNIGYSFTKLSETKPITYFDHSKAEQLFNSLYTDNGKTIKILNTIRPNIIIMIMESFTAKIIEPLGGRKGITPNFTALCHDGILFDNFYANGDRTDKGTLAVLSGYPGHPELAIVNFPKKTESLPYINHDLMKLGYRTEFIYGSDIDFANFRSYFVNADYDSVISKADFPPSEWNSKWGPHDHFVLNKLMDECNKAHEPFFMAFASLSSHEPFEVPMKTVIPGSDEESQFLNSIYYADSSLGGFFRRAKNTSWWKNTLFVIVADHSVRHPDNTIYYELPKYKIPMLWLGGAVAKKDTIIHTFCTQSDLAFTILNQLDIHPKNYKFSQNILSSDAPSFSYYLFKNGFGFLKKDKIVIFDNNSGQVIRQSGDVDEDFINKGKAYMQVLTTDFAGR